MALQQTIDALRNNPSIREKERTEQHDTIKEMEATLHGFIVTEIHDGVVIITIK
jgi:hypothetical protein